MSRTEKLYERLVRCEREYLSLMREEFELLASSCDHREGNLVYASGSRRDLTKFDRIVWLEKEILGIRHKLREPVYGSVVGIVEQFRANYSALGLKQRPEKWIHMCKITLAELNGLEFMSIGNSSRE